MQDLQRDRTDVSELLTDAKKSLDEGIVPLRLIADPRLFELEQEKLFAKTWYFLAHESELPNPGDYVLRYIGARDSVIVIRDEDGRIGTFLNICRHRGARLVKADMGNTSHFRCFYHGFTYNNKGDLIGMPVKEEAYGDSIKLEDFGLYPVRIDSYKGMIFANLDGKANSLSKYLGDTKFYLDFLLDKTVGGVTFHPPQRAIVNCNWKVAADNIIQDNYHVMTTHVFAFDMGFLPKNPLTLAGPRLYCGNGHGVGVCQGITDDVNVDFPRPVGYPLWWPELLAKAKSHMPTEQFELWSTLTQMHGNIFPNLGLLETTNTYKDRTRIPPPFKCFKLFRPIAHDKTEIWLFFFVEKDAPEEYKQASYDAYVASAGAAGLFDIDDMENWYNVTQSSLTVGAKEIRLLYKLGNHRGLDPEWKYPGQASKAGFSEYPGLQFWRTWFGHLTS